MSQKPSKRKTKSNPEKAHPALTLIETRPPSILSSIATDSYRLEFTLPGLPKIITNGNQGNWRAKHFGKKEWQIKTANMSRIIGIPYVPLTKALVTLIRYSSVEPDYEGLVASFKPILDGLVRGGVIIDDRMSVIGKPTYDWEEAPPRMGRIKVLVESA